MRICDFKIFRYQLPLVRALTVRGRHLSKREGFIIKLSDEHGNTGYGETAPLPGASLEMPDAVLSQLQDLRSQLMGQTVPANIEHLNGKFSAWLQNTPLAPSVRFGIETAVLSLKASHVHKPLAELIDADYQTDLTVNGLLQGPREVVLKEAQDMLNAGYHAIKFKIGGTDVRADIETVNTLASLIAGRALLRLDANKAWDFDQALQFSKEVNYGAIEYIEEPLKDFSKMPELYAETTIPLAVDESLKEHSLKEIKSLDGIEVIILKPTLVGGFEKVGQLAAEAKSYGIRAVISSSFESGIGIRALANLAACFSHHAAAGLDTVRWFERDTVSPALHLEHGRIQIEQCQLHGLHLAADVIHEV